MSLIMRRARHGDAAKVLGFIRALAVYEKLDHQVESTEADLDRDLFGPQPRVFCEIAEWAGEPVGFALWFYTYSTFRGRHGIWLEDLFVDPDQRGEGIGAALLSRLARFCVDEELGRLEWQVLDWNMPAIEFYRSRGAVLQNGWTECRVDGEALKALAARSEK